MRIESVLVFLVVVCSSVHSDVLTIDKNTNNCGDRRTVSVGREIVVKSKGESPGVDCSYVIDGQAKDNCRGLCYDMKTGSYFKDPKVALTVVSGKSSKVFDNKYALLQPVCSDDTSLSITLTVASDYVFDPKTPGYDFSLAVYNKCDGQSISFDEAAQLNEGYHHGEEFHDKVRMNLIQGILVGCALASVFLILLIITYCYYKNSPNRGRSRSVGMPKVGFSKKMNVKGDSKKNKEDDPEAHFKYRTSDPERVVKQPESKPLLTATADPEKPPFDPSVDPPPASK